MVSAMLALLVAAAPPQFSPESRDPQGWLDLRWGMTVEEVRAALVHMSGGAEVDVLPLPSGDATGQRFQVWSAAEDGTTLVGKRVLTFRDGHLTKVMLTVDAVLGSRSADRAQASLAKRFGKPSHTVRKGPAEGVAGEVVETTWLLRTTRITLTTAADLGAISLEYAARMDDEPSPDVQKLRAGL